MASRQEPNGSSGRRSGLWVIGTLLVLNSLYLYIADQWPTPPRTELATFFYLANVLLHLFLGLVLTVYALAMLRGWLRALAARPPAGRVVGWLATVSVAAALLTGLYLLRYGNLAAQRPVLLTHIGSAVAALVFVALFLALRARAAAPAGPVQVPAASAPLLMPLVILGAMMGAQVSATEIKNPRWAPASQAEEGGGQGSLFWPSSAETLHEERFFPPEYFTNSAACQECHTDIYEQWSESAHRFSSFNNQWYRKSIEYMQEVIGPESPKWCAGCHDPALLFTEMPGTGRPRMDFPIKDQVWPPEEFPEAHAGLACASCHSIVGVKSTMGQADVFLDYPPMHKYAISDNPMLKGVHDFLIRRAPNPHKKTFLRPFMRQQPADFCSSCHKVHLDVGVNNFRWVRGFNEYDAWQQSGVSGNGAGSFYYPSHPETGEADFKRCIDCHMPLVPSDDDGNKKGFVRSHRFPAANTALPTANQHAEQMKVTVEMLKTAVTVDVFALRRGAAAPAAPEEMPAGPDDAPRALDMSAPLPAAVVPSAGRQLTDEVIAPLEGREVAVRRGEEVSVDVVVRTRNVGHVFPGGTMDAFDTWVEFIARDERGRVIFSSGHLEWPDGPVDRWAHFYRALMIDENGNPIFKRNAWAMRTPIYVQAIPPGAGDTVRYRVTVPPGTGDRLTLSARVLYRKFMWWNTQFAFGGRPLMPDDPDYGKDGILAHTGMGHDGITAQVTPHKDDRPWVFDADTAHVSGQVKGIPTLPIIELAKTEVTLRVVDGPAPAPQLLEEPEIEKLRVRWNDYGIGFLRIGDLLRARYAFEQVTALAPQWPEGYVNLGRTYLTEGNLDEARRAFERGLDLYAAHPNPMTRYFEARTRNFYGMMWKRLGEYDRALHEWDRVVEVFPNDRNVRNERGIVHFLQGRFAEAIAELEHTLTIDPEDVVAHYNLMRAYRGLGDLDTAARHEELYRRFKLEETQTQLRGPYLRANPWDNTEAQFIHEHRGQGWPPRTAQ